VALELQERRQEWGDNPSVQILVVVVRVPQMEFAVVVLEEELEVGHLGQGLQLVEQGVVEDLVVVIHTHFVVVVVLEGMGVLALQVLVGMEVMLVVEM